MGGRGGGEFHQCTKEINYRAIVSLNVRSRSLTITNFFISQSLHVALNVGVDLL